MPGERFRTVKGKVLIPLLAHCPFFKTIVATGVIAAGVDVPVGAMVGGCCVAVGAVVAVVMVVAVGLTSSLVGETSPSPGGITAAAPCVRLSPDPKGSDSKTPEIAWQLREKRQKIQMIKLCLDNFIIHLYGYTHK
jgi:hypothetical protein